MRFADNPEREQILDQALDARTIPEITTATQNLREWVKRNPDDVGITEVFEGLSLMRDIAEEQVAECLHSSKSPALAGAGGETECSQQQAGRL